MKGKALGKPMRSGVRAMNWWEVLLRLGLATLVGCIIGVEREKKHRPAGMRTHMLLCVGAATVAVLESLMLADTQALNGVAGAATGVALSRGRLSAQVISGIGFLGAGTIFMSHKKIAGLTTAASLWNAACLGLAVGMGYYGLGLAGCGIVMLTLTVMQRLIHTSSVKLLEVVFVDHQLTQSYIRKVFAESGIRVLDMDMHMEKVKGENQMYTYLYTLDIPHRVDYAELLTRLAAHESIRSIRTLERGI